MALFFGLDSVNPTTLLKLIGMASSGSSEDSALGIIHSLPRPSVVLDPQKTWYVGLACEVGKEFMYRSAREMIIQELAQQLTRACPGATPRSYTGLTQDTHRTYRTDK